MKTFILLFISILWLSTIKAQKDPTFFTVLEYNQDLLMNSIIQVSDGGFVLTGKASIMDQDIIVSKLDADGNYQWSRFLGYAKDSWSLANDEGIGVINIPNEDAFVVLGSTLDGNSTALLKLSYFENTLWQNRFKIGYNTPRNFYKTTDENFIIVGSSSDFKDDTYKQPLIFKADNYGSLVWSKQVIYSKWPESVGAIHSLVQNQDETFMLAGVISENHSKSESLLFLAKTNNAGDVIWDTTYYPVDKEGNVQIFQYEDQYKVLCKDVNGQLVINKITKSGDIQQSIHIDFGNDEFPKNFISNGDSLITATYSSNESTSGWFYNIKDNGTITDRHAFSNTDVVFTIKNIAPDELGGYVVIGEVLNTTSQKACVFKLDREGYCYALPTYDLIEGELETKNKLHINDKFNVSQIKDKLIIKMNKYDDYNIKLIDIFGRTLYTNKLSSSDFEVSTSSYKRGIYFFNVSSKISNSTTKIFIE